MQFPQPNSRTMPFRVASIPAALFILSTFFQRLGIWFAGFPFPLVLISSPFLLAYGLIKQRVKLSSTRLILFRIFGGVPSVTSIILANRMTATSALAYFLIYTQWVLYYPVSKDEYIKYLQIIAVITSAICLIGAMQYFSQFIVKSQYVFTWKGIIPSDYLVEQNTLNELSYNSGQYKSNGFFLTEPSSLSGLAARILLLVVILLKDIRFVVPLIIGLLFSLSELIGFYAVVYRDSANLSLDKESITGASGEPKGSNPHRRYCGRYSRRAVLPLFRLLCGASG